MAPRITNQPRNVAVYEAKNSTKTVNKIRPPPHPCGDSDGFRAPGEPSQRGRGACSARLSLSRVVQPHFPLHVTSLSLVGVTGVVCFRDD